MPKVFGYVRVSTESQAKSGLSQSAQKEKIQAHFQHALAEKGFTWGRFYEDAAVSGKTELILRDQGKLLNHDASKGDVIVFSRLDRGFRNTRDLLNTVESWAKRGVGVVFLDLQFDTTTAIGMLFVKIVGAFADFERSLIVQRIQETNRQKIAEGRAAGYPPRFMVNKRVNGVLRRVPDEREREQARMMIKLSLAGYSHERIYWHFRKEGVTRTNGKEWSVNAIRRAIIGMLQAMAAEEKAKKDAQPESNGSV